MTCLHCQSPIESETEQAPKCLRIRSTGDIVWKRMHDLCTDLYLIEKTGFELVEGEEAEHLLEVTAKAEAQKKLDREKQSKIPKIQIRRVQRPLRLGEWARSKMLRDREARR